MKKKLISKLSILLLLVCGLTFSSCLKDSRFVDFSKVGTIVELPFSGNTYFGSDAVTATPDTTALGVITQQFAVNIASPTAPTTATTITFSVDDPAIVTTYNASNSAVSYLPMPSNAYSFTQTSVTIPAGQRTAILTVKFYKNLLDPSKSYMLPIAIKSAGGLNISTNLGIHYYHFIGNDFAGVDVWDYRRYNGFTTAPPPGTPTSGGTALGQVGKINPVTPTEFQMVTGYNGQGVRYDVTFTRSVAGSVVTYSNWAVTFVPADVTGIWLPAGITVAQQPVFQVLDPANKTFTLQYVAFNGTAYRYIIDSYHP